MRKMIYLMLALLMIGAVSMNAQVTIGSQNDPHTGAVLDLQSTNKGLLLPNVSLQNVNSLNPLTGDLQKAKGMIVYNTNPDVVNGSGVGLYIWDGAKWRTVSVNGGTMTTTPATLPVFPKDGGIEDITINSPGCDVSGPYTFQVISGSNYAAVNPQTSPDGKFKLGFAANTTALEREAVVLVIDPCGKTTSFTFKQNANPDVCQGTRNPIINVSNSGSLCTNGAVYMDIANAESGVDYIWMLNDVQVGTGNFYVATQAGSYVVYAGSMGCTYKATQNVTSSGSSAPAKVTDIIATNGGVLCAGGNVQLTALNPPAGTIDWYKDGIKQGTGNSITLTQSSQSGKWFAVMNNGSGCLSQPSNSILVTNSNGTALETPQFSINGQTNLNNVAFCKGGSLTLQIVNTADYDAGCNYQWFANGVALNTNPSAQNYYVYNIPSDVSQLTLSVSVAKPGSCSASMSSPVKTVSLTSSAATTINSNESTFICGSDPATLTAGVTNAAEYYWYRNGVKVTATTTNVYTTTQAGSYQVAYKDVQGCVSFLSSPVTVSNSNTVSLSWNNAPETAVIGQTLTFSVNAAPVPDAFEWKADNGATVVSLGATTGQANITFNNPGTTNVTVTARNGCGPVMMSKTVVANAACLPVTTFAMTPGANFGMKVNQVQTLAVTSSDGSAAGKIYSFYVNGVQKQSGSSNTYNFTPTSAGNYTLKVAVANNCTATPVERSMVAEVTVDPVVIPDPVTPGVYSLSGITCFDIAQTEGGTTCGPLSGRVNSFASTHTFTYTFLNTQAFSGLSFVKDDASSIIKAINYTEGNTVTVTFDDNILNIARGTDNITAKKAILYAVFNDNTGAQRKISIALTVKDCICCGNNGVPGIAYGKSTNYRTYQYGEECWMVDDSKEGSATMNGNLYAFSAANAKTGSQYNACPTGWRLPTTDEFTKLAAAVNANSSSTINNWWFNYPGYYACRVGGSCKMREVGLREMWWTQSGTEFVAESRTIVNAGTPVNTDYVSVRCVMDK